MADGVLAEHWDVLQDEATAESQSGPPMFGSSFPAETRICRGNEMNVADQTSPKTYRRVVTGCSDLLALNAVS